MTAIEDKSGELSTKTGYSDLWFQQWLVCNSKEGLFIAMRLGIFNKTTLDKFRIYLDIRCNIDTIY